LKHSPLALKIPGFRQLLRHTAPCPHSHCPVEISGTYPGTPVDSKKLAKVTSSDHMSYFHFTVPKTPHRTLPLCIPIRISSLLVVISLMVLIINKHMYWFSHDSGFNSEVWVGGWVLRMVLNGFSIGFIRSHVRVFSLVFGYKICPVLSRIMIVIMKPQGTFSLHRASGPVSRIGVKRPRPISLGRSLGRLTVCLPETK